MSYTALIPFKHSARIEIYPLEEKHQQYLAKQVYSGHTVSTLSGTRGFQSRQTVPRTPAAAVLLNVPGARERFQDGL